MSGSQICTRFVGSSTACFMTVGTCPLCPFDRQRPPCVSLCLTYIHTHTYLLGILKAMVVVDLHMKERQRNGGMQGGKDMGREREMGRKRWGERDEEKIRDTGSEGEKNPYFRL